MLFSAYSDVMANNLLKSWFLVLPYVASAHTFGIFNNTNSFLTIRHQESYFGDTNQGKCASFIAEMSYFAVSQTVFGRTLTFPGPSGINIKPCGTVHPTRLNLGVHTFQARCLLTLKQTWIQNIDISKKKYRPALHQ